jgi:hypothetical protein
MASVNVEAIGWDSVSGAVRCAPDERRLTHCPFIRDALITISDPAAPRRPVTAGQLQ